MVYVGMRAGLGCALVFARADDNTYAVVEQSQLIELSGNGMNHALGLASGLKSVSRASVRPLRSACCALRTMVECDG